MLVSRQSAIRLVVFLFGFGLAGSAAICRAQSQDELAAGLTEEKAKNVAFPDRESLPEGAKDTTSDPNDLDYTTNTTDEHLSPEDIDTNERNFHPQTLLLPSAHLFKDWLGLRSGMEDDGITPTVTWVTNMAGNPAGGRRQGFTECENLGASFLFDLEKRRGITDTTLFVSLSQRSGQSLTKEYVGNVFTTQQVFGGETFRLVDFQAQRLFFDGNVDFHIGRIAAGDDFLVSPYDWFFMQNAFDGNPVAIFLNSPGMTAYPNATWGARIEARATEKTYLMAGVYNGDPGIRDNEDHGMDFSLNGPLFTIMETGYQIKEIQKNDGKIGNYRLGTYYDGSRFDNSARRVLDDSASQFGLHPGTIRGNWGFYTLCDQVVYRPGGVEKEQGLGVFGSVLVSPDDTISQMPFFAAGGLVYRGLLPSRPLDSIGFGVVYGLFSDDLRNAQRIAQNIDPTVGVQGYELVYEWAYRIRMRDGAMFFEPDFQYIVNPGAANQYANAFVVGLQAGVNF